MSRLRVTYVHAVEQDGHLVESAAIDADIGLHTESATLPHIHSECQFQQIVNTKRSRLRNFVTATGGYNACRLIGLQWSETPGHLQFVELIVECIVTIVGGFAKRSAQMSGFSHACHAESGHCQDPDAHLATNAAEGRIGFAVESVP